MSSRLLDLRPGEVRRVFRMFALIGLIIATSYILKPVRSSLFLTQFGAERLPYVYLAVALVLGFVATAFARLSTRAHLPRLFVGTSIVFATSLVGFWALTVANWPFTGFLFYVWVSLFTALLPSLFWLLANYIFYSNEGRRLFPVVMAGGLLGSILGGAMTSLLVPIVGTAGLLLAAALLLVAIALLASWNAARERERIDDRREELSRRSRSRGMTDDASPYRMLTRSRYLALLAALISIGSLVSTLVDFQFNTVVEQSFLGRDALTEFFGTFFAAINVLAFLLQLFVAPRLLSRFGVGSGLVLLPLALTASSIAFLGWPALGAALFLKSSDDGLGNSVHRASVEVLYLPVPLAVKNRLKAWLDMFVERASRGVAGLTLLAAGALSLSAANLAWVVLALLVPWIVLALALQREYVRAFRDSIRRRELADFTSELRDPASVAVLHQVLSSEDERETLYSLQLLPGTDDPEILKDVEHLTRHESGAIRAAALRVLRSTSAPVALDDLAERARDEDAGAAAEAMALFIRAEPEAGARAFEALVDENDPRRLGAVLDGLEALGEPLAKETVVSIVAASRADDDPLRRKIAARALGFVHDTEELLPTLSRLLTDPDVDVARAAVTSAGRFGGPEALRGLLEALRRRPLRAAARRAIARYGDEGLAAIATLLRDPATDRELGLALPAAATEAGGARAVTLLLELLPERDPSLHFQTIKALDRLRGRISTKFPRAAVEPLLEEERRRLLELSRQLAAVTRPRFRAKSHELLVTVLEERLEFTRERIFRLLGMIYPRSEIQSVWSRIEHGRPAVRAQALEYLANLLEASHREALYPLVEAASWAEVEASGRASMGVPVPAFDVALRQLALSPDGWVSACAATLVGDHPVASLAETLRELLAHELAAVREAAERSLSKLEEPRTVGP